MNNKQSPPPALAVWLLRRLYPQRHRESLLGDLLERFREGHSDTWFWRQVVVAILVGSPNLRLEEICLASVGTGLIWCVPWARLFPIAEMTTSFKWGAQARWLVLIEIMTALVVLPLFALRLRLWRAPAWRNLLKVFTISAALFAPGDLLTIWWCGSHPTISGSNARWLVMLQLAWIFATLLFSAGLARRLPSQPKTIAA